MRAIWKGTKIAESNDTVVVEGNHYFPMASVDMSVLTASDKKTNCHWKGIASYYNINVDGDVNADACWYYPEPKEAAKEILNHVAFWGGVEVSN